jgi:hypothetical protein
MMNGLKEILLIVNDAGGEIVSHERMKVAEDGEDEFTVPADKLQPGHTLTVMLRGIDENSGGDKRYWVLPIDVGIK